MESIFGDISIETFLSEYWQKKPLLVRNAFPNFIPPIEPDDMAGLSLEEDVESRLILEDGPNHKWHLENGPFSEDTFENLPEEKWTLLVQAVDQWVPEMADLLRHFTFLPSWRLDDIMASFAVKGGSVGPHFDQYDVFLIQAQGQRHWQVGPQASEESNTLDETPLSILSKMEVTEEWTVNPGDLLYIPPKFAHNGVAVNDCMTFSVGFRAPSEAEVLQGFTDHISSSLSEFSRYSDAGINNSQTTPAKINTSDTQRLKDIFVKQLSDENLKQWLAEYMTESKYDDLHEPLEEPLEWDEISGFIKEENLLSQNETSRWAYYDNSDNRVLVINGHELCKSDLEEDKQLIEQLANCRHNHISAILALLEHESCKQILLNLINENFLYFDEP